MLARPAWKQGRLKLLVVAALLAAGLVPLGARGAPAPAAFVPDDLRAAAAAQPDATFEVIVLGRGQLGSTGVASAVKAASAATPGEARGLGRRFVSVAGVSAELTGKQLLALSHRADLASITPDAPVALAGGPVLYTAASVAGLPQVGSTLSAVAGYWLGAGPISYLYQWRRCDAIGASCADIAGATGTTYAVATDDVGTTLRIAVTASDSGGSTSAVSNPTAVVAAAPAPAVSPPAAGTPPAVSGTAEDGSVLTATSGDWTGASSYDYRWQRCSEADRPAAVLGSAPLGFWRLDDAGAIAGDATGHGVSGSYLGGVTEGVAGVDGDAATSFDGTSGAVDITGLPNDVFAHGFTLEAWVKVDRPQANVGVVGKWKYAQNGGVLLWIDESGNYALVVTASPTNYLTTGVAPAVGRWEHLAATWDGAMLRLYRNGALIGARPFAGDPGTPSSDLVLADYDGDGHHLSGALDDAAVYDRALSAAEIGGHAAGCRDIAGATGPTLSLDPSLIGARVRAVVTATGTGGTAVAASTPTAAVAAAAPAVAAAPTLSGPAARGRALSATAGTWQGTGPLSYGYQWQRCDGVGGACADVAGATGAAYTPTAADVGATLRIVVTATGPGGSSSAASATTAPIAAYSSAQVWPYAQRSDGDWPQVADPVPNAPAIAIVDSGIDASRADFGGRVVQQITLTSSSNNSPGDGRGHGTFVAGIAAGSAPGYAGADPTARLVSIDVLDDSGMARTSDVIAAADWIYQNHDLYGIRVANLSLQESAPSSIQYDPLDKAVEKLWLSGIVVVTASGNFGVNGAPSGEPYAPGNDPFLITVGAVDVKGTVDPADDVAAPWSAYGYTADGFEKPELGAPGRYLVGPIPPGSTLASEHPDQLVGTDYMQLSGTSFATAAVSGAASAVLARHPDWTPDQVKGALMLTARVTSAAPSALGVGELDAAAAAAVQNPPNPNLALRTYVVPDPAGGPTPVFDSESWGLAAQSNPAWGVESWGLESWGLASWGVESWGLSYWSGADAGTGTPAGSPLNAATDAAAGDFLPGGGYWLARSP